MYSRSKRFPPRRSDSLRCLRTRLLPRHLRIHLKQLLQPLRVIPKPPPDVDAFQRLIVPLVGGMPNAPAVAERQAWAYFTETVGIEIVLLIGLSLLKPGKYRRPGIAGLFQDEPGSLDAEHFERCDVFHF